MVKKNLEPEYKKLDLRIPKYTKCQKVVGKAISTLQNISPERLQVKDRTRIAYVMGLLESIMMVDDGSEHGNN